MSETENSTKMDVSSSKTKEYSLEKLAQVECQQMEIEAIIKARQEEIDTLKIDLKAENDSIKAQQYKNRQSSTKKVIDLSKVELLKKSIGIKKNQIKRNEKKLENLKSIGRMTPAKKKTDRTKVKDLHEEIKKLKSQIEDVKKEKQNITKAKDEELERLKRKIEQQKEQIKISGWECKYLNTELSKLRGKPSVVSDVELQNYINRHTQVIHNRSIYFE